MAGWVQAPFLSILAGLDELHVCADPGVLEHGFWSPSGAVFFEGSVTRFHCQDGFKLKGSTKRLCVKQLNGTLAWVPSDRPICVQEGRSHARGTRRHCLGSLLPTEPTFDMQCVT